MENKEKWYTTKEACVEAGVSQYTINNAIRAGKLVATPISDSSRYGYHYLISESALFDWIEDRDSVKVEFSPKVMSLATAEDIAKEIADRIQKAYDAGFKEGMKQAKAQMMVSVKEIKI